MRNRGTLGIATAMAMGAAPLPSRPGRTRYVANVAEFSGEVAFGASIAHRRNTDTNIALTAGYAHYTAGGDGFRARIAGEFWSGPKSTHGLGMRSYNRQLKPPRILSA